MPAPDPSRLMDELLGAEPVAELKATGKASRRLASKVAVSGENPEPLLAGVFWWAVINSDELRDQLSTYGVEMHTLQAMLVAHAEFTRFDLLVLSPHYDEDPVPMQLHASPAKLKANFDKLSASRRGTVADRIRQKYPKVSDRLVREAITEVATTDWLGVVLAPAQEMIPTCVPVPGARVVNLTDVERPASVGLFIRKEGAPYATTVLHVFPIGGRGEATIGTAHGTVCREDTTTDSCLIALDRDLDLENLPDYAGVLRHVLPPFGDQAWFSRPDEGRVDTVVLGADMSILEPQQDFASKIYTHAVTIPGDSGVALVNTKNEVVCFAVRRTSIRASVASSQWIYAEQALTALGVLEESR